MRRLTALAALALLPSALAHGSEHGLDDQLVRDGQRLMLGSFDAPQPGPLLVVPYLDGPLPCGPDAAPPYLVPVTDLAGLTVLSNATHVLARLDLPAPGFAAFALDTQDAVRALILMQEKAVALHRLVAQGQPPGSNASAEPDIRSGLLGIPYDIPGASAHRLAHDVEAAPLAMDYDAPPAPAPCRDQADLHVGLALERVPGPEAWSPGRVVHAVALYDPAVDLLLPRPLETTQVLQVNLYLARPGEDAARVRAALNPAPGVEEAVPGIGLLAGLALATRRTARGTT